MMTKKSNKTEDTKQNGICRWKNKKERDDKKREMRIIMKKKRKTDKKGEGKWQRKRIMINKKWE